MILGIEVALIVVGIMAIARGRLPLDKTRSVYGMPARLLGFVALTPIPVSAVVVAVYLASHASSGDPAAVERAVDDNRYTLMIIEATITLGVAFVVFGLGRALSEPPRDEMSEELARLARPARPED